jgi:SAM-dependent methyltransferase
MLAIDSREAEKRRLAIEVVQASMDQLSPLRDEAFDIVHQPVSSCYVASLEPVFGEVARVLRDGGLYVSQHKQPASLQVSHRDRRDRYVLGVEYFHEGPLPEVPDQSYREDGTLEFLHRWEQLVGTLCQAGFVIEDLREPLRADRTAQPGDFRHRGRFIPPYVRLKARRNPREETGSTTPLWTPDS